MRAYHVPSTTLSILHSLSHVILLNLRGMYCFYPPFTDEAERLTTCPASSQAGVLNQAI